MPIAVRPAISQVGYFGQAGAPPAPPPPPPPPTETYAFLQAFAGAPLASTQVHRILFGVE